MPEDMKAGELLPLVTKVVAAKLSNGKTASSEVAFDDLAPLQRLASLRIHWLKRDPIAGLRIELVKLDALDLRCGRDKPYRARHQRQAQMAIPAWAHGMPPASERGFNGQRAVKLLQGAAMAIALEKII